MKWSISLALVLTLITHVLVSSAQSILPAQSSNKKHSILGLEIDRDWLRFSSTNKGSTTTLQSRTWHIPSAGCFLAHDSMPLEKEKKQDLIKGVRSFLQEKDFELKANDDTMVSFQGMGVKGYAVPYRAPIQEGDEPLQRANLISCFWTQREASWCEKKCAQRMSTYQANIGKAKIGTINHE